MPNCSDHRKIKLMLDQPFKTKLEAWVRPLVDLLVKWGVHPDVLTWLGFILSSSSFVFILSGRPVFALCLWWFGRVFDGLDGILARASGKQSVRGGFLDINLDMAAYSIVAVGFMLQTQWFLLWALILVGYVLCITSALSLGEIEEAKDNRSLRIASGLAEAGETGIFYTLMWLFPTQGKVWCVLWLVVMFMTVCSRFLRVYRKGSVK